MTQHLAIMLLSCINNLNKIINHSIFSSNLFILQKRFVTKNIIERLIYEID